MTKRQISVVIAEALIAVLLAIAIIPPFTPTPGYYPDLLISMYNGGGWGRFQNWEIRGNGNVSYESGGLRGVELKTSGKISPQKITELVVAIKLANVWGMKESYAAWWICMDCTDVGLSITLNGQSRHIQYHADACTSRVKDAPPMVLCGLQHMIEATGRSALPTPTHAPTATPGPKPTPPPTATPPPTRTPTSTPPAIMKIGDFGIISQTPCGPPCFHSIRPSKITLGEFIAQHGPPDSVGMRPDGRSMMFFYDSLQTALFASAMPPQAFGITPGVTIDAVAYLTAAEYRQRSAWIERLELSQQAWKGYGTYTPNMKP